MSSSLLRNEELENRYGNYKRTQLALTR